MTAGRREPEPGLVRATGPLALGVNVVNCTIGAGQVATMAVLP
jgi:hypothetical protein